MWILDKEEHMNNKFRKESKKMMSKKILALVVVSLLLMATNGCPPEEYSAPVSKTGQTTSYATGDDGDLQRGVMWPNPRFTDNGDGTVIDNLTGLIWLKDANCFGGKIWADALSDCNELSTGSCGLTDGSNAGDWRLANYKELISLIDVENYNHALPTGHPFNIVQSGIYWTSSSGANSSEVAWTVGMSFGYVESKYKSYSYYVWPVRGGH